MNSVFDPTLEDDVKQLLTEVPLQVRTLFASGRVEEAVKSLIQKNQLHVDQGAVVEREVILLLLGLKSPAESTRALEIEGKMSRQTVDGIVRDVNDQIFVPLREEIQKGGGGSQPSVRPVAPRAPARPPTGPWPRQPQPSMPRPQVYAPPPQSPRYTTTEEQLPAGMRFATPSKEMSGIKRESASVPSVPAETPLQQALRAVTARPAEARPLASEGGPPQNLPGTMMPPPPLQEAAPPPPSIPVRNSGDIDPYREPIE